MTSTADRTRLFHALHQPGPLALPNAWDVASALIVEAAGAKAVATTSAGVAWTLGAPDGNRVDRDRVIDLVGRIAKVVSVPVTADIESGFGEDAQAVGATAKAIVEAGASGVNIEDGLDGALRDVQEQKERLSAASEAAPELYINARIDAGDWKKYAQLCDEDITCFEPEAERQLLAGLPFHKFYFDLPPSKSARQSTMASPHVRVIGSVGIVCYARVVQKLDASGAPVSVVANETRIWRKDKEGWKHIHFHRS